MPQPPLGWRFASAIMSISPKQRALGAGIEEKTRSLELYEPGSRKPGDIWFAVSRKGAGHTNMTYNSFYKVDSVQGSERFSGGVRQMELDKDRHHGLVYRFSDAAGAQRAAHLAYSWKGDVGYADGGGGKGLPFRTIGSYAGTSHFGRGAQGRLMKYKSREGMRPKNVICSEMCILAYQLCMAENHAGFIQLDAKHSTPATLMDYFDGPGSAHWQLVAYKKGAGDL